MGDTPRRGLRSAKVSTRMLAMVVVPVSLLAVTAGRRAVDEHRDADRALLLQEHVERLTQLSTCLLYTSPSPRD